MLKCLLVGQINYDSPIGSATRLELEAGYSFNDYFTGRLSYLDLGKAEFKENGEKYSLASVGGFSLSFTGASLWGRVSVYTPS